eukprot:CAMPEP_0206449766 /NCGR_PEP_ID=MMETSP0324_2-20121206/18303_1 /ASSEMBLY_ACC=CAM_ASM_000836 /TAXON_ID=2866 /ORGANISM="Crypthecodinium cohnii, Strain Seligo" /LENGTH=76 /DNA_ID=CAMNT_0053919243 /DNA_START=187 /DNA_END=414 /DNA_ORIENTATION=+
MEQRAAERSQAAKQASAEQVVDRFFCAVAAAAAPVAGRREAGWLVGWVADKVAANPSTRTALPQKMAPRKMPWAVW